MPSADGSTEPGNIEPGNIEHLVTSGLFSLDGGQWEVENNVWLIGDSDEVIVIDAPHDAQAIADAVGGRRVVAIACTHAHDDHVRIAPQLSALVEAPVLLHPSDRPVWALTHPDREPDGELRDGQHLQVAGIDLQVLLTPGHAPGAVCFYAPELSALFSGDTLFQGGPGATGRSFSDFPTIISSIESRLLDLPDETVVYTGHGPTTTIGDERPHLSEWIARGH
jgi:glyoxylase-like metal-dependent hydrolase (beta-lactamase superfamily II)